MTYRQTHRVHSAVGAIGIPQYPRSVPRPPSASCWRFRHHRNDGRTSASTKRHPRIMRGGVCGYGVGGGRKGGVERSPCLSSLPCQTHGGTWTASLHGTTWLQCLQKVTSGLGRHKSVVHTTFFFLKKGTKVLFSLSPLFTSFCVHTHTTPTDTSWQ